MLRDSYAVLAVQGSQLVEREVPMLNALNEVLRDDYIKDSVAGVNRWNKVLEKAGIPTEQLRTLLADAGVDDPEGKPWGPVTLPNGVVLKAVAL